jgi:DNA-binding transcriptional ArsR family regulator
MDEYAGPLDDVFSALAHPTRRRMLELLASRDWCVTELAERFPSSLNVASKHVKSLERAGLISRRCQGRIHHLKLNPAPLADASEFINRYRKRWERQLERLAAYMDKLKPGKPVDDKSKAKS